MLFAFKFLCMYFDGLHPSLFSFFLLLQLFFEDPWKTHIFHLKIRCPYLSTKVPNSQKGWKDSFIKIERRSNKKKRPCWITSMERLAFPIKWSTMEKRNFKKGLNELREEGQTTVDVVMDTSQELWDIIEILGHYRD